MSFPTPHSVPSQNNCEASGLLLLTTSYPHININKEPPQPKPTSHSGAPSLPAEGILMTVYFSGPSAGCCLCHLNFNFLIYSLDKTEWSRIWAALYIGLALSSVKFGALQTYSSDYLLRTSRAISISAAG